MPTDLDTALDAIMDKLTAAGAPAETVPVSRGGVDMPSLKNAPPSLVHYFAHYCNQHGDLPFLIDGDIRISFAQAWDAAQHVAAGLIANHGVARGDRVGIAARNSANWIIAYMGILAAGGCATAQWIFQWRRAGGPDRAGRLPPAAGRCPARPAARRAQSWRPDRPVRP